MEKKKFTKVDFEMAAKKLSEYLGLQDENGEPAPIDEFALLKDLKAEIKEVCEEQIVYDDYEELVAILPIMKAAGWENPEHKFEERGKQEKGEKKKPAKKEEKKLEKLGKIKKERK